MRLPALIASGALALAGLALAQSAKADDAKLVTIDEPAAFEVQLRAAFIPVAN